TKPTAAVLSLNRLSASTSNRRRPLTPASLKVAMIETGSVAAIRTPNRIAAGQIQPSAKCIIAAVTPVDIATPTTANVTMTGSSLRNSVQLIYNAASNISGGSNISNTSSLLKAMLKPIGR